MSETVKIALVGCSSQKASRRCEARDLYTSQLFRAARAYAERTCHSWYVLSARFGLLAPTAVVDPYDQVLTRHSAPEWGARVGDQLATVELPEASCVDLVVLAGRLYADWIVFAPFRCTLSEPLRGMGIGERLRWLQQNTPRAA